MPAPARVDPTLLAAAATRVAVARDEVAEAAETVLDHLADAGDRLTQGALDALVDQAADVLRALTEELTGTTRDLRSAAARYAEAERDVGGRVLP